MKVDSYHEAYVFAVMSRHDSAIAVFASKSEAEQYQKEVDGHYIQKVRFLTPSYRYREIKDAEKSN